MQRANLSLYTLTLAAGLSALAAGAVHLPILAGYAALVLLSALLCVFAEADSGGGEGRGLRFWFTRTSGQQRAPLLAPEVFAALIWFGLAGFCLLQAAPLPLPLLARLSPEVADIWSRSLRVFSEGPPAFASLSLAPGRSLVEAAKAASYGVVLLVAADIARRRGYVAVLSAAFLCALAVALVTAAHQLAGAERLYGFYEPVAAFEVAPLLNPNNRAGYLSLGFFCGLAVLFYTRGKSVSLLVGVGLMLLLAESIMCRSRGGTLCLLAGLLVFVVWPSSKRSAAGDSGRLVQAAIIGAITLGAAIMAVLAIRQDGWEGLFYGSTAKLELFETVASLIRSSAAWGIGRGAFGTLFPSRQEDGVNRVYDHAENFVLQWAAEWGVPITVFALASLLYCFYPLLGRRVTARSVRRAAVVGVGVLVVQNLVDLGLEVPAVAALLACVLGALSHAQQTSSERAPLAPLLKLGSAMLATCILLMLLWGNNSPARERASLHAELVAGEGKPTAAFWLDLRRAIQRFPADPYFPLLGASAALADGKNGLPWVSRALERAPASAQSHLVLARILWARHAKEQALGALRHAVELDATQSHEVLELVLGWKLDAGDIQAVIPQGQAGARLVELLSQRAKTTAERMPWLESWVARVPQSTEAQYQLALTLVEDAERGAALCEGQVPRCLLRAGEHLARAGGGPRVKVLEARWLVAQGRAPDAEAMLRRACSEVPADVGCALALVELTLRNHSPEQDVAIRSLVASACTSPRSCADIHRGLGDRFAGAAEWHAAFDHYQRAIQELPEPALYRAAARAAEALDRPQQAAALSARAQTLEGSASGKP